MARIKKECPFLSRGIKDIDYRDIELLRRFVSSQGKIIDPRHTGVSAKFQRKLARAIKRARIMGLLPFVGR
ncbi:MAG: 30S ribosomal protein S18 [Patescibacteria group bacterium]